MSSREHRDNRRKLGEVKKRPLSGQRRTNVDCSQLLESSREHRESRGRPGEEKKTPTSAQRRANVACPGLHSSSREHRENQGEEKTTNIYRLLASRKDRVESQRIINIGGMPLEQSELDGKESEYRIRYFFKAWATYCGILIKLAPSGLPGKLGSAL